MDLFFIHRADQEERKRAAMEHIRTLKATNKPFNTLTVLKEHGVIVSEMSVAEIGEFEKEVRKRLP